MIRSSILFLVSIATMIKLPSIFESRSHAYLAFGFHDGDKKLLRESTLARHFSCIWTLSHQLINSQACDLTDTEMRDAFETLTSFNEKVKAFSDEGLTIADEVAIQNEPCESWLRFINRLRFQTESPGLLLRINGKTALSFCMHVLLKRLFST
jgi:hypothetical protein